MKIKSIKKVRLKDPIPVYDVYDVQPYHNFLIKAGDNYIVSHNCGMIDEISFAPGSNVQMEKSKIMITYNGVLERMSSRFMVNGEIAGKLFLVSSKKAEHSFLENYIQKKKNDPHVYVADAPLWEVKPDGTYSGTKFMVAAGGSNLPSKILDDYIIVIYNQDGIKHELHYNQKVKLSDGRIIYAQNLSEGDIVCL